LKAEEYKTMADILRKKKEEGVNVVIG